MKAVTIILAIGVIITSWIAWVPAKAVTNSAMDRVGTVIGKTAQPSEVAEVTVATWDEDTKKPKIFQVKRKGESWSIPSHFDYPADGGTRVGKTAGMMGAQRGRFVTEDPKRFDELGVIDPTGDGATAAKSHGKRVTIKDGGGAKLVDLIVGNSADGGTYFVREADSNEVFTAKVDVDISTRFIDWVKPDLLQIKKEDIRGISIQDYSVNEKTGSLDQRATVDFNRATDTATWESKTSPQGKRPKKEEVDKIVNELTWLRLAGIRPFQPEWLQARGFFLSPSPALMERPNALVLDTGNGGRVALVGNEGQTTVTLKNGLSYQLFFGEIALGDDADTAADAVKKPDAQAEDGADAAADGEEKLDAEKAEGHNRYLVVFVTYDPSQDQDAAALVDSPEKKAELSKEHQATTAASNKRFQSFFYVISDASFAKLRPAQGELFEALPEEAKARGTDTPISVWMKDNGVKPGITTTNSGLQYEVVTRGPDGGKKPTAANTVQVRYKGTLIDGTEFDASGEEPAEFAVSGVIKGWTEALQLMQVGDVWKLTIPPGLAYGEAGSGEKIGPSEILHFDVELVDVVE